MRWRIFSVFVFLSVILSLSLVSASFQIGTPSHYLNDTYDLGDKIVAWVNISFTNEPYNSTFEDSFGNTHTIQNILNKNNEYVYNDSLPLLNSSFQILTLNDAFIIPGILGDVAYELNLTGITLLSGIININTTQDLSLKVEAAQAINSKKADIAQFNASSKTYTGFIKEKVEVAFDVLNFDIRVEQLETLYSTADSNADYQKIIDDALLIRVPKLISESKSIDNIKFYADDKNVDFDILTGITGEEYDDDLESSYSDALFIWNQDEIDMRIAFKEISASYGFTEEVLFRYFEVQFPESPTMNSYFIIESIENLEFEENYGQIKKGNYYYINLGEQAYGDIIFITSENVDFVSVPMFVSPALMDLPDLGGEIIDSKKQVKISRWIFFGLVILLLLVLGMVIYSIVSTWYDKKYERYLFPNRNNLYNLIIYVNNSKRKGISNEEIAKNLRKSKWSGEQIKYVLKKYSGKRTGMVKLPFNKVPGGQGAQNPQRGKQPGR